MGHNYQNGAGNCLIRDYQIYLDRDCTVPAVSLDVELDAAMDVANSVATHAGNQCGVIGHLFPFSAPFGRVYCD